MSIVLILSLVVLIIIGITLYLVFSQRTDDSQRKAIHGYREPELVSKDIQVLIDNLLTSSELDVEKANAILRTELKPDEKNSNPYFGVYTGTYDIPGLYRIPHIELRVPSSLESNSKSLLIAGLGEFEQEKCVTLDMLKTRYGEVRHSMPLDLHDLSRGNSYGYQMENGVVYFETDTESKCLTSFAIHFGEKISKNATSSTEEEINKPL